MEKVDILEPPTFKKSGKVKTLEQAWNDEDWIATFNLWIVQKEPIPSIVYQQRSPKSNWAPSKLDVTAGGHLDAGEEIVDGLREVKEELGKSYKPDGIKFLGRKLYVSPDTQNRMRQNVVHIYMVNDNSSLKTYKLQEEEVYAVCVCPIDKLIKVHTEKDYSFVSKGVTNKQEPININVTKDSFPYNWDNYHFKIALLAKRYLDGDKYLIY